MAALVAPMAIGELNCPASAIRRGDPGIHSPGRQRHDVDFRYLSIHRIHSCRYCKHSSIRTPDCRCADTSRWCRRVSRKYAANARPRDWLVASAKQFIQNNDTTTHLPNHSEKASQFRQSAALKYPLPDIGHGTFAPHQPMAAITAPDGRTTNPRVYAIGLQASCQAPAG